MGKILHTIDKIADKGEQVVDSVTGTARQAANSFATLASNVAGGIAEGAETVGDFVNPIRKIARKAPNQVSIVDLFHRKLFSYVDWDYVIEYLQKN